MSTDKIDAIHPNKGRNRFSKGVWDSGIPTREGWTMLEPEMPEQTRLLIEGNGDPGVDLHKAPAKPKKRKA